MYTRYVSRINSLRIDLIRRDCGVEKVGLIVYFDLLKYIYFHVHAK